MIPKSNKDIDTMSYGTEKKSLMKLHGETEGLVEATGVELGEVRDKEGVADSEGDADGGWKWMVVSLSMSRLKGRSKSEVQPAGNNTVTVMSTAATSASVVTKDEIANNAIRQETITADGLKLKVKDAKAMEIEVKTSSKIERVTCRA